MTTHPSVLGFLSVGLNGGHLPLAAMEGYNPTSLMHEALVAQLLTFGSLMIFVAVVVLDALWAKSGRDKLRHGTIRLAIERGQPLPPELLDRPAPRLPNRDRTRGLVLIAFGLGLWIFLKASPQHAAGLASLGAIPILVGAALILSWALDRRDKRGPDQS